jgi:hypothetical protein
MPVARCVVGAKRGAYTKLMDEHKLSSTAADLGVTMFCITGKDALVVRVGLQSEKRRMVGSATAVRKRLRVAL